MTTHASLATETSPLDASEWGECLIPQGPVLPELEAEIRRHLGATPDWVGRLTVCPWLGFTCAELFGRPVAHLDEQLWELIALVVSRDNSCRYCYGIQRALFKVFGRSDEYLDRLERDFHSVALSPQTRAALTFARKISRADPRPRAEDFSELTRAGFSRTAIAEIAFTAAANVFMNRFATLLALPSESIEMVAASPIFRFVRPLMILRMGLVRRLQPPPRAPEPLPRLGDGPGAAAIAALGDSPAAPALERWLMRAWSSDVLPRRTKGLMAAVIARALGCANGETEARRALAAEGVSDSDVDEILSNLGSPSLDAREARLVPFARDTVRYQPSVIQRRAREACADLSPAEIIEVVGVTALMNAVSRLTVLLALC